MAFYLAILMTNNSYEIFKNPKRLLHFNHRITLNDDFFNMPPCLTTFLCFYNNGNKKTKIPQITPLTSLFQV